MKIKIKNIYYYCLFIWLMANYAMRTGFSGINLHVIGIVYRGVTWACIFLIIFRWLKYVNDGLITTKCFFLQSTILAISFLSYFKSGRDELLLAMIFIVGAINTERDKVFRIAYRTSMLGTLIVTGCYLSGIINSSVTNSLRDGVNVARYSMGFSHPNAFAAIVLQLTVLYLYFNYKKVKTGSLLLCVGFNYLSYRITYSRTSFTLAILFLIIVFCYKNSSIIRIEKIWNWIVNNITKILLFVGLVGSVYVAMNYKQNLWLFNFLSNGDTLQTRVRLMGQALEIYPITLLGQVVNTIKSSEYSFALGNGVVLDNAYIFSLLAYGILPTIILVVLYYITLQKEYFSKNILFIISAVIFIILGFSEKYFMSPMYNFTLLGLSETFYQFDSQDKSCSIKVIQNRGDRNEIC